MKNCDCVIGICWDYDDTDLYTISRLKRFIIDSGRYKRKTTKKEQILEQLNSFCTLSGDPYLEIFKYCPMCGKKIDIDFKKMVDEVLGE